MSNKTGPATSLTSSLTSTVMPILNNSQASQLNIHKNRGQNNRQSTYDDYTGKLVAKQHSDRRNQRSVRHSSEVDRWGPTFSSSPGSNVTQNVPQWQTERLSCRRSSVRRRRSSRPSTSSAHTVDQHDVVRSRSR